MTNSWWKMIYWTGGERASLVWIILNPYVHREPWLNVVCVAFRIFMPFQKKIKAQYGLHIGCKVP